MRCAGRPGLVLHVQVNRTQGIVPGTDGKPYVRVGAQNLPQDTPEKLRRLEFTKGVISFEGHPASAPKELIVDSPITKKFVDYVVPKAQPEAWLKKHNRIEVQSPGRLPAHVTPKNILDERFARNGAIVRLLNKFPDPPNRDVGEGLNTAFDKMRELGLPQSRHRRTGLRSAGDDLARAASIPRRKSPWVSRHASHHPEQKGARNHIHQRC